MQGQRISFDSFPEVVDIGQGSVSNTSGMSQQTSLNNTLHPVESPLSNYMVSSAETTSLNVSTQDVPSFSGWNTGEPSSRMNPQNQVNDDGTKTEHGWSSSFNIHSGSGPRLNEGRFEGTNFLFPGRVNIGISGNRVRSGPLFMQGSSSTHIPQNVNLNATYVANSGNSGQDMGSGIGPNLNRSSGLEIDQRSTASSSFDNVGTSSGCPSYMVEENNGGSSSSLGTWGLSCKRKSLEGTSGQSYTGGSSSSFPQGENVGWHTGTTHYNPSDSLYMPSQNSPVVSPPEQQNLSIGIGVRGATTDGFPLGVTGDADSFLNYSRRLVARHQQEAVPLNLSSTGSIRRSNFSSHQSPRPVPFSDFPDLRPTAAVSATSSGPQSQSHAMHMPGLSGNMHSFQWNGVSNSRVGSLSSSVNSGERGPALREESNLRGIPRHSAEHPMFVPATDVRNSVNDPTSWSLATGNLGNSGGAPSTARIGPSSSMHTLPNPTWIPRHPPPSQNQQRLSEFPWSLFPSMDSESGGPSGHFTSLPPGPSTSSQDTLMSSGPNSQGRHQQYPRSAFFLERPGDDVLGSPHSLRALAVDIEGRRRLVTEIRQVLSAMRRGENIRAEWIKMDWAVLEADRTAGGILLMWDKRVLDKMEVMVGTFSVSVKWQGVGDGFIWACLGVYGPNENDERGHMWDELVGIHQYWRIPWCCFGDFNIVRFPSERRGESCLTLAMETFFEFFEDLNLVDLPLEGGSFTWSSGSDQPAMSRIDRFLVTPDWEDHFPDVFQRLLPRPISGHSPILLEAGGMAGGKSLFRFENMWLKSEGFMDRVHTWWNRHSFVGTPSFVLAKKLKALKEDIVQWNHREFGNVGCQKKQLLEELKTLDTKEGDLGLFDGENCHRAVLRSQVEHLLSLEEIS